MTHPRRLTLGASGALAAPDDLLAYRIHAGAALLLSYLRRQAQQGPEDVATPSSGGRKAPDAAKAAPATPPFPMRHRRPGG